MAVLVPYAVEPEPTPCAAVTTTLPYTHCCSRLLATSAAGNKADFYGNVD